MAKLFLFADTFRGRVTVVEYLELADALPVTSLGSLDSVKANGQISRLKKAVFIGFALYRYIAFDRRIVKTSVNQWAIVDGYYHKADGALAIIVVVGAFVKNGAIEENFDHLGFAHIAQGDGEPGFFYGCGTDFLIGHALPVQIPFH
jgi:hypothetical protein